MDYNVTNKASCGWMELKKETDNEEENSILWIFSDSHASITLTGLC
jgi:hypothetical protein